MVQVAGVHPANRGAPALVRVVGIVGVILVGFSAISIALGFHLYQRAVHSLVCPFGSELHMGGWANASLCVGKFGAASSPATQPVGLLEPAPSLLLLGTVVAVAIGGGFWLARRIWRR